MPDCDCGNFMMDEWDGKDWIYKCDACGNWRYLTDEECKRLLGLIP